MERLTYERLSGQETQRASPKLSESEWIRLAILYLKGKISEKDFRRIDERRP